MNAKRVTVKAPTLVSMRLTDVVMLPFGFTLTLFTIGEQKGDDVQQIGLIHSLS